MRVACGSECWTLAAGAPFCSMSSSMSESAALSYAACLFLSPDDMSRFLFDGVGGKGEGVYCVHFLCFFWFHFCDGFDDGI